MKFFIILQNNLLGIIIVSMVKVSRVSAKDIKFYSEDPNLADREQVPISRHRALSYAANPRADSSDIVLYLAFKDDLMVGYRSIVPDYVFAQGKQLKVGWLSGNWVHPDYRRKGIASFLLNESLQDWNSRLLFTNFANESKAVYDKSELFQIIHENKGARFYLRSSLSRILPLKNVFFKGLKPFLIIIDFIFNFFNSLQLFGWLFRLKSGVSFEYLNRPDQEVSEQFEKICENTPTRRNRFDLQWILRFPWLVSSPLGDRIGSKYFFSSSPSRFCQLLVKVYLHDNLIGFIIFNHTRDNLTVPYISFTPKHLRVMVRVILKHALRMKSSTITIYNPGIAKNLKRIKPFGWFSKTQLRSYYATKVLREELKGQIIHFNDGDGDCAFI